MYIIGVGVPVTAGQVMLAAASVKATEPFAFVMLVFPLNDVVVPLSVMDELPPVVAPVNLIMLLVVPLMLALPAGPVAPVAPVAI